MKRRYVAASGLAALVAVGAMVVALPSAAKPNPATLPSQAQQHVFKPIGSPRHTKSSNLDYHGGVGGIGVETAPRVYLVFWGSQWNNNDPSGEAGRLQSFLGAVGGSSWLNSVTQYCQGIANGSSQVQQCFAANPTGILVGSWSDSAKAAPSRPSQSQLAAEAVVAAAHFGNTGTGSNTSTQYVIARRRQQPVRVRHPVLRLPQLDLVVVRHRRVHNLPYITDAGSSCGANFVNGGTAGKTDGITIVEGHELAETITDQFPNGGWLDGNGAENGDKCAWISSGQGESQNINLGSGTFAVQSLWSNAFNSGAGGCVTSY